MFVVFQNYFINESSQNTISKHYNFKWDKTITIFSNKQEDLQGGLPELLKGVGVSSWMLICGRGKWYCQLMLQVILSTGPTHPAFLSSVAMQQRYSWDEWPKKLSFPARLYLGCTLPHFQFLFKAGLWYVLW